MGNWTNFYKVNPPFSNLKDLIIEKFDDFKNLCILNKDDYNKKILKNINDFKIDFDKLDQKIIDEITSDFIGLYYDFSKNHLESFGPSIYNQCYNNSTKLVIDTCDDEFINLWKVIIIGRSIKNNQPFKNFTNEYKIGFLTNIECNVLRNKLKIHFERIYDLRTKNEEAYTGIESLMRALDEVKNYKNEIVIAID